MLILGIEAAAKVAGVALWKDGQIISEEMVNGTLTHSETLMPMVDRVMRSVGVAPEALTAIALSAGPGSFTGLRLSAGTGYSPCATFYAGSAGLPGGAGIRPHRSYDGRAKRAGVYSRISLGKRATANHLGTRGCLAGDTQGASGGRGGTGSIGW